MKFYIWKYIFPKKKVFVLLYSCCNYNNVWVLEYIQWVASVCKTRSILSSQLKWIRESRTEQVSFSFWSHTIVSCKGGEGGEFWIWSLHSLLFIFKLILAFLWQWSCPERARCQSRVPKSVHWVWRLSKVSHTVCLQMFSKTGKSINCWEPRDKEDEDSVPKFATKLVLSLPN